MNYLSYLFFLLLISTTSCAQPHSANLCANEKFDNEVNSYLSYSIPILSVQDLNKIQNDVVILDARELEEYNISHIKNAKHIGYDKFDKERLKSLNKNDKIIVYCSIGYRSEKIGEKLKKHGFTNVYNLYGSIFEWANVGYPLVDNKGNKTTKLHTYNKKWSKWVDNTQIEKIY